MTVPRDCALASDFEDLTDVDQVRIADTVLFGKRLICRPILSGDLTESVP